MFENYDYSELCEPNEVDLIVIEATDRLMENIKCNFKAKINLIQKENESLKKDNEKLKNRFSNFENEIREFKTKEGNLEREVKRMRLSELLKDFEIVLYAVAYDGVIKPKCNLCNDKRRIEYTTPTGKVQTDRCNCDFNYKKHYYIEEYCCSEFKRDSNGIKIYAWYKYEKSYGNSNDDTYTRYDSTFKKEIIEDNCEFDKLELGDGTFFRNKDTCQKYCDFLNEIEDKKDLLL